MIDLKTLYDSSWDEAPEPQHVPGGHWELECTGMHFVPARVNDAGKEISPQLGYFYRLTKPLGDVSKKELERLNGYDYTDEDLNPVAYFTWYGGAKERAHHKAHIAMHKGSSPSGPILEPTEGNPDLPRVRKEFREGMLGGRIVAKLKPGADRDGSPRMEVDGGFLPVEG